MNKMYKLYERHRKFLNNLLSNEDVLEYIRTQRPETHPENLIKYILSRDQYNVSTRHKFNEYGKLYLEYKQLNK